MIDKKYIIHIREIVQKHVGKKGRVFIFGSSVESAHFSDIDLGVIHDDLGTDRIIQNIKNDLEESNLPYTFDVVDIHRADELFRNKIMNNKKIWII